MKQKYQNGVALIVTLIMLSLITFLAVAFLAITQRERQNVSTSQSQFASKVFADVGFARAQAEIVARMMALSNTLAYDIMVSRNQDVLGQNLGLTEYSNLVVDPRVPVFVRTNSSFLSTNDDRFYVDFNRDGRFQSNGVQVVIPQLAADYNPTNVGFLIGDPEWIGILQNPDLPYSSTNRFIGRYAYMVIPSGKTLDINTIHNYNKGLPAVTGGGKLPPNMRGGDGFTRGQGAGPWEINLAGFFTEWNTNFFKPLVSYNFVTNQSLANTLPAFDLALEFLQFRYQTNFNTLSTLQETLGPVAASFYTSDYNDIFGHGSAPTSSPFGIKSDPDVATQNWAGSPGTNAFSDIQEFFGTGLTNQLGIIRSNNLVNTYDRTSFYRLAAQIGTESSPELDGKMNLNFTNDIALNVANTNFVPWTPLGFFTNAADRMLRSYYGLSITNIPVYNPTNVNVRYSAGIHRVLQLAANIYEATRTNVVGLPMAPKVFRPILVRDASKDEVFINGFLEITNVNAFDVPALAFGRSISANGIPIVNPASPFPIVDLTSAPERTEISDKTYAYGIPLVIGARKGLPNFNELLVKTGVTAERKLQLNKVNPPSISGMTTNQMFLLTITNFVGMEAWNSYTNRFSNQVDMVGFVTTSVTLTNNVGFTTNTTKTFPIRVRSNVWDGLAFSLPISTNFAALPTSIYDFNARRFIAGTNKIFYPTVAAPTWGLSVTNKIKFAIFQRSGSSSNLIDFVMLQGLSFQTNLSAAFYGGDENIVPRQNGMWLTNIVGGGPTQGELNQIKASLGQITVDWKREPNKYNEITNFVAFMAGSNNIPDRVMQAPFTPAVSFIITSSYGVNDPLVHYTDDDLYDPAAPMKIEYPGVAATIDFDIKNSNLGRLNTRYDPWGGNRMPGQNPNRAQTTPTALTAIGLKDSLVRWPDDWQFPTNFLPNIGWLGKIHRGTPWQTIYFKSTVADNKAPNFAWRQWSGSLETHPTNDWRLPDLFTVATSENAARGLLSVNQTNTASWAALFAGLLVKTNSAGLTTVVQPYTSQLNDILTDIYRTRTNEPAGTFNYMGRILSVPALSVQSPYLTNAFNGALLPPDDSTVESIAQQTLSLMQLGRPRLMIYAYGQSLAPAPNSILTEFGANNQICTNYTVTGEVLTKTLLRIEGDYKKPRAVIENFTVVPQN